MSYTFFDAHCDTLSLISESGTVLRKNTHHLDLERLKQQSGYIQTFAAFADRKKYPEIYQRTSNLIDLYQS